MDKNLKKVGSLEVFENTSGNIVILDVDDEWAAIEFDECMAEKLCKCISEVATAIREKQDERK